MKGEKRRWIEASRKKCLQEEKIGYRSCKLSVYTELWSFRYQKLRHKKYKGKKKQLQWVLVKSHYIPRVKFYNLRFSWWQNIYICMVLLKDLFVEKVNNVFLLEASSRPYFSLPLLFPQSTFPFPPSSWQY